MTAGRPTEYKPEYCQRVLDMGAEGMSITEMAGELKVTRQTLFNWTEAHAEFFDAMQQASEISQCVWERHGRMATFSRDKDFNFQGWWINMRNRFRKDWFESSKTDNKTEVSGNVGFSLTDILKKVDE